MIAAALDILLRDSQQEEIRRSAVMEGVRQDEGPRPGRSQHVVDEDLEATRYRILTGLPMAPMPCWRW